jgi:hypothetical protein
MQFLMHLVDRPDSENGPAGTKAAIDSFFAAAALKARYCQWSRFKIQ